MKIAFTSKGQDLESQIDARFGRTDYIICLNEDDDSLAVVDNTDVQNEAHGAGPKTSKRLFETGAEVLITGNGPGGNAAEVLKSSGIKIYVGAEGMTAASALEKYKNGGLKEFAL